MGDRLLHRGLAHLVERPGAEWAARRGKDNAVHGFGMIKVENLEDGVVLGIDGNERGARGAHFVDEDLARADETLFVGERHTAAVAHGGNRGCKARSADNTGHHPIHGPARRFKHGFGPSRGFDTAAGKRFVERVIEAWIADHGNAWPVGQSLLD